MLLTLAIQWLKVRLKNKLKTQNSYHIQGLYEFVHYNGWTQVAIICGASGSGTTYYSCAATQHLLKEKGIKVSDKNYESSTKF